MIGQLLAGHYQVLEVLGEGGFGQTYIVEDIHLPGNPKCVLKHLKTTSTDPEILETASKLFEKEAETLQQLGNHDQIPRLLAYFQENQEFYLVQEFIDGHTLNRELQPKQTWTESQIVEMLFEVLGILEFVHSQGVIHRDIKPENIIRRASDNKLVLIDFGSIKQLRNQNVMGTGRQNITLVVGTRGYMPSEQTRRLPRPSSDIYAVGMMGIQALTGVYPHELQDDPNTGEVLWQHLKPISPELSDILTKMTRYHFKDRYQTVSEVLLDLRELAKSINPSLLETPVNTTTLHALTLEWQEAGELKARKILEKQQSKNPGRIRIGRDPLLCDIVVPDPTVSGLHVEIFFHAEKQLFYLRNLRQKNPPIVDGQLLLAGEMPLCVGSCLRLGKQDFQVTTITCQEYPNGYVPREYALVHIAPQQPILQTARIRKVKKPLAIPRTVSPVSRPKILQILLSYRKKSPVVGAGAAALMSAIAGLVFFNASNLGGTSTQQSLIAQPPQLCRVVSPAGGKFLAKLRPEPQTEVGALKQISLGEKVLFVRTKGDFVKVQLSDGTQGWVFGDEIQPCDKS
ncbi:protein kinase [Aetokthonos hydrillicola Thurmond2011]|jgi:serine/threonine-protein kinase|uniref:non-specific serine/threonine protein kinase n=1 Tax=Aetokthonos hydrillicola Thurmond2011 TaxID=2712845 RepID=A0AAP5MD97_9CYAN|nr:protein kinase [Aetokthonos hydrillicola]MBW4585795.1 protein kinase [Aetokthonos hydrillicola CCALA 1050]MDR9899298.1 protein kinase [Aetokthonos hydrillicola Thurmond2011]